MKILSARQIREADAFTIKQEPIASIDLMERASLAFVACFEERFGDEKPVWIFCGTGNNGGDGLAIARLLSDKKFQVTVVIVKTNDTSSDDFASNEKRLAARIPKIIVRESSEIPDIAPNVVVIDAIFGSGLSRAVTGLFGEVIDKINLSGASIVSVDIASGLFADQPSSGSSIIQPDYTISFQLPKMAFLLPENHSRVGEWEVADIRLSQTFIDRAESQADFVQLADIKPLLKNRSAAAHKGDFGKALLFAGSRGKMGAAILSARACMRSGTGLLTVHAPACGYEIMQIAVPEAMISIDESEWFIAKVPEHLKYDVIGIGPGIDTKDETANLLEELLRQFQRPVVIDADGLNLIGRHKGFVEKIPKESILTPHAKEFERIAGPWNNDYERLDLQKQFSVNHGLFVIFKGAHTTISTPDGHLYFNSTGNPGMATAGSGDVLTGIITSILGQGYTPLQAAILGVYLHGLAGDLAANEKGQASLIASDIIDFLPAAFGAISRNEEQISFTNKEYPKPDNPANNSRSGKKPGKVFRFLGWGALIFFLFTFTQVLLYKFIPPLVTPKMLMDKFSSVPDAAQQTGIAYHWQSYDQISKFLVLAVIASEDQKFPDHFGFDIAQIEKAYTEGKQGKRVRGASTITQQVAKNLFLWPGRNYFRKGVEAYYTFLIELLWSKQRIVEIYLNIAEMGPHIYGAEAAAQNIFNKSSLTLSRPECALLAAVLPNPIRFSAKNPSSYINRRKNWILKQMHQLGDLNFLEKI